MNKIKKSQFVEQSKEKASGYFTCMMGFVTIPKSGALTKKEVEQTLISKGAEHYIIVQEKHKDGEPHFHAIISKRKGATLKIQLSSFNFRDSTGKEHHGNIMRVFSKEFAYKYCLKEDASPLIVGDIEELCAPAMKKTTKLTIADCKKYNTLCEVMDSEAGSQISVLNGERLAKGFEIVKQNFEECKYPDPIIWEFQLKLFRFEFEWCVKQNSFFIWGDKNCGKSWFVRQLVEERDAKKITISNGNFVSTWYPNAWLLIIDDQDTLNWQVVKDIVNADVNDKINLKGGWGHNNRRKVLMVFSNRSPKECFRWTNPADESIFEARFKTVHVTKQYPVQELKKREIVVDLTEEDLIKYKNKVITLD